MTGAIQIRTADTGEQLPGATASWSVSSVRSEQLHAIESSARMPLPVDAEGRIAHQQLPSHLRDDVMLLVSHPGFIAASHLRSGGSRPDDWPAELRLERAAPFAARVVDALGRVVVGATVRHQVDRRIDGPISRGAERRRPWLETSTSGADGLAALSSFPGRNQLQASLGDLCSAWWTGTAGGVVELRLLATFRVAGRVIDAGGELPGGVRVRALARQAEDYEPLATCAVARDGSWRFDPLPVLSVDSYVFLLEGAPFAQQRRDVRSPVPGSIVDIEFAPVAGIELQVHVLDPHGDDVEGAFVSAHWNDGGAWQKIEQLTDAAGIAALAGCRPGSLWVRARAKGCAPVLLPETEHYVAPPVPIEVELARGGRIEGTCRDGTSPADEFDVHFWQGLPTSKTTVHVTNSADGSFVIEEAPLGEVTLMAVTRQGSRTEEARVEARVGDVARVSLATLPGSRGSGRIISAASSTAIPGARAQLLATSDLWKIARCGEAAIADAEGRFDLTGLIRGRNVIEVSAPGHASKKLELVAVEGETLQIGAIGLHAQRAVEVSLVSEGDFDCTTLTAQLSGENFSGDRRFPSECELRYEALDPGRYTLRLQHGDGSSAFAYFELASDRDRQLEIGWPTRTLTVEVVPSPGTVLAPGCWLLTSHRLKTGEDVPEYYPVPPHRRIEIRKHDDASRIVLQLEDPAGTMLALESFDVGHDSSDALVLKVTDDAAVLRVDDRDGEPVPGAILSLFLPDDPSGWGITQRTDEHGTCTLRGFLPGDLIVNVYEASIGLLPSRRVSIDRKEPNELVLDAALTLRARVVERGIPLPSIEVDASDSYGVALGLGKRTSDADGLVRWDAVGAGDFRLRAHQSGIWPAECRPSLGAESSPAPLEVRRRGNLELHVQGSAGAGLGGALVDLYSMENLAWASEWLAHGRIEASSATMRTDDGGRLRFSGLPNGEFRYRVTVSSGATVEDLVNVPPGSTAVLEVVVP